VPESVLQFERRQRQLAEEGCEWAYGQAWLEQNIANWPPAWGDEFRVYIYGDFNPPTEDLRFPSLGITVRCQPVQHNVLRAARCVLEASVSVKGKTIEDLADAGERVNILLGGLTLVEWCNCACGWWSRLCHPSSSMFQADLHEDRIREAVDAIAQAPEAARRKLGAALYWVREPHALAWELHRQDTFRVYVAYWNAFECLVGAINQLHPPPKAPRGQKQQLIDEFVRKRAGRLSVQDVQHCYHQIVNPGLVGAAEHALRLCFGDRAAGYMDECFRMKPARDRLYEVRNSIAHGEVAAEDPVERFRIETRLRRLWRLVISTFGCLIPLHVPVDES
jgi:hypothetical protein